jgi:hypothetical protein
MQPAIANATMKSIPITIPRTIFVMPLLLLYGEQLILATRADFAKETACSSRKEKPHWRKLSKEADCREYRIKDV